MPSLTKRITVPLNLVAHRFPLDTTLERSFNETLKEALQQVARDDWYPTSPTDFSSLWEAGLISSHPVTSWMGNVTIIDSVSIDLTGPPTLQHYKDTLPQEPSETASDPRPTHSPLNIICPGCGLDASVFDVHCVCGAYLSARPIDETLQARILEAFDQYYAAKRAEAEAAAKASEPSIGQKIAVGAGAVAVGVGAVILGMIGSIANEVVGSPTDWRLQRNLEAGIRRAR